MAKNHLLKAACTIAMLAAAPAFAQTNTETGSTGPGGVAVNPTAHEAMTPADNLTGSHTGVTSHSTHRAALPHTPKTVHGQDAAVDQLNDQSYQAAHNGQAFDGASAIGGNTAGSRSMSGGGIANGASSNNGSK